MSDDETDSSLASGSGSGGSGSYFGEDDDHHHQDGHQNNEEEEDHDDDDEDEDDEEEERNHHHDDNTHNSNDDGDEHMEGGGHGQQQQSHHTRPQSQPQAQDNQNIFTTNNNNHNNNSTNERENATANGGTSTTNQEQDPFLREILRIVEHNPPPPPNSNSSGPNNFSPTGQGGGVGGGYGGDGGGDNTPLATKYRLATAQSRLKAAEEIRHQQQDLIDELTFELEEAMGNLKDAEEQIQLSRNDMLLCELAKPSQWNNMYRKLVQYQQQHGHCNVPYSPKDGTDPDLKALGRFVGNQRVFYKYYQNGNTKHLKPHRIDALERIGFVWKPKEVLWNSKIAALEAYKARHGHLDVPLRTLGSADETKLGKWVSQCRNNYLKYVKADQSTLTPERVQQLTDMGFVFVRTGPTSAIGLKRKNGQNFQEKAQGTRGMTPEQVWQMRFKQLKEFHETHGHVVLNKRDILDKERRDMDEHLRAEEAASTSGQGQSLERCSTKGRSLKNSAFHKTHGEAIGRHSLSGWLAAQRKQYQYFQEGKPSILNSGKINQMEALGVTWQPMRTAPRKKAKQEN
jgi:hypothetical protein